MTHHHIVTNPYDFITSMEHKNICVVLSSNIKMPCWPANTKIVHMTRTDHYFLLLYLNIFQKFKWDLWDTAMNKECVATGQWRHAAFFSIFLFLYSMDERLEVNYSLTPVLHDGISS